MNFDLLPGHTSRVISISQSADRSVIASAGADETIRLWKCFAVDKKRPKPKSKIESDTVPIIGRAGIR